MIHIYEEILSCLIESKKFVRDLKRRTKQIYRSAGVKFARSSCVELERFHNIIVSKFTKRQQELDAVMDLILTFLLVSLLILQSLACPPDADVQKRLFLTVQKIHLLFKFLPF